MSYTKEAIVAGLAVAAFGAGTPDNKPVPSSVTPYCIRIIENNVSTVEVRQEAETGLKTLYRVATTASGDNLVGYTNETDRATERTAAVSVNVDMKAGTCSLVVGAVAPASKKYELKS